MTMPLSAPSRHYKHAIVSGAIEHSLPIEYIEFLQRIEVNDFQGHVEIALKAIAHLNGPESSNF